MLYLDDSTAVHYFWVALGSKLCKGSLLHTGHLPPGRLTNSTHTGPCYGLDVSLWPSRLAGTTSVRTRRRASSACTLRGPTTMSRAQEADSRAGGPVGRGMQAAGAAL